MMVFHRRLKRVKIFSETLITKYLYKCDSCNTSKRNTKLLEGENSQEKRKCSDLLVNIGFLRLKVNVFILFNGCLN